MNSSITPIEAEKNEWDVIIVGGGPAGSFMAFLLAQQKIKVLLIDKDNHPRFKVCGGCLSGGGISILKTAGLFDGIKDDFLNLTSTQIFSRKNKFSLNIKDGVSIDRARLDTYLLECAAKEGAFILLQTKAKWEQINENFAVYVSDTSGKLTLKSKILINATGVGGAEKGSVTNNSYVGAASQWKGTLPLSTVLMAIGKSGYVGVVELKGGIIDCAAALSPDSVKSSGSMLSVINEIVAVAGSPFVIPNETKEWKGTPLLSHKNVIASNRYFAVGDACGYVEPFTGEGITWALESSLLAAPLVVKAVSGWSHEIEQEWVKLYRENISRKQKFCRITKEVLRFPQILRDPILNAAKYPFFIRNASKLIGAIPPPWI